MDATFITLLALLVLATVIALVQARRRDACLKAFDGYHLTLAEKGGDLSWGAVEVETTGLEVTYAEAVVTPRGYAERSFLFYKDQYAAMDALYRFPDGLPEEERQRRQRVIERTAKPGALRRFGRRMRNWMAMVRDALVQAVGLVIGAAKARQPGAAVLASSEAQLKTLSTEIIGHVGNAYDPLLERHLWRLVTVEVTRDGVSRSYDGYLKNYTAQFVEVLDVDPNPPGTDHAPRAVAPGEDAVEGLSFSVERGRLVLASTGERVLYVDRVEAGGWQRTLGCVLPPGFTADLHLPADLDASALRAWVGAVDRVDMVVPRAHALVRHASAAPPQ